MININGSPKTGTHLLLRAVVLFEGEGLTAKHEHLDSTNTITGAHLHIKRNPRNALISYIRHLGDGDLSTDGIIRAMPALVEEMKLYLPWTTNPDVLNVSFESLLTDPAELERIATYLSMPCIDDHFLKLWGNTPTFSGKLSNWRDYWNDDVAAAWIAADGAILEQLLGYSPDTDTVQIRKAYE